MIEWSCITTCTGMMREFVQYSQDKEHVCRWQEWHGEKIVIWIDDEDPVEIPFTSKESFAASRFISEYLRDPDVAMAMLLM